MEQYTKNVNVVAMGGYGFYVVDISDPSNMKTVGRHHLQTRNLLTIVSAAVIL